MSPILVAIVIAILSWWLATAVVIILARKGARYTGIAMVAMSVAAVFALAGIYASSTDVSVSGAYVGFVCALVVWAWHEMSFLLGVITGPRRTPCPADARGSVRFKAAFDAVRDHELALFATMLGLILVLRDAPNKTAMWVFVLLWVMRVSTKLNLFLGVPNAISDMLPAKLDYLKSYFRTDRVSMFFVPSLCMTVLVVLGCMFHVSLAETMAHKVSWAILATFAGLAIVEHLFLVLPFRDADLWPVIVPKQKRALAVAANASPVHPVQKNQQTTKESTARQGA